MVLAVEIRSPCLNCERAYENKLKCSKNCDRLAQFQQNLPRVIKFAEETNYHIGQPNRKRLRR
ncbi:MAG: hypothetical protein PVF76_07920 [Syntrophobacterales bacterium]